MRITDFTADHIERAICIAKQNYEEERLAVPALPFVNKLPDLCALADNGLGVTAFDGGEMIGFLCCHRPRENHFGLTKGTFSPIHAHGAVQHNRVKIYDRLYQSASEKWVAQGILSHAVALYAHDREALGIFFNNGFGNRCVDSIRETDPIATPAIGGMTIKQVPIEDAGLVAPLNDGLVAHLRGAPMFMPLFQKVNPDDIAASMQEGNSYYFAAYEGGRMVAYLKLQPSGENFASDDPSVMNISGAFCLPEYRGRGIYTALLSWLMDWLRGRGCTRCGVDFESFNYTAHGFWLKHFTAYTNSVVRRIDERIIRAQG